MNKFTFKSSIAFPYLCLHEDVTYEQVTKPNGISYILLVLISESKDKDSFLGTVLTNFGIPKSLHYIFWDELVMLYRQGIITTKRYLKNIDVTTIGDFEFTEKGRKIFAEEAIPTGINKNVKVELYYDIARNELKFEIPKFLEPKPLNDSFLTPDFITKFNCLKNPEDFLNLNKGNRWPQKGGSILIKDQEIITQVSEINKQDFWTAKEDCDFKVEDEKITFVFDDELIKKFFEENYTSEMINKAISFKNKFNFQSTFTDDLSLKNFDSYNINEYFLPLTTANILGQKFKLSITLGNYNPRNGLVLKAENGFKTLPRGFEFISLDEKGNCYGYILGKFIFNNEKFGSIKLPLGLKVEINKEILQEETKPCLKSLETFSVNNFSQLVKITNLTKDTDYACYIIKNYMTDSYSNNVDILNSVKDFAILNPIIHDLYIELVKVNFEGLVKETNIDNLETNLKISHNIYKSDVDKQSSMLEILNNNLKNVSQLYVYELLVKNGFSQKLISLYFNPVSEALKGESVTDRKLIDLVNYNESYEKLSNMLNIDKNLNSTINLDNVSLKEINALIKNIVNLKNNAEIFRDSNKDLFNKYDNYWNIIKPVNDDINLRIQASKNPKEIKKEAIEKLINKGEFLSVFANLAVKLEYILRNTLKSNGEGLFNLIQNSNIKDKKTLKELHNFRESRNNILHYGNGSKVTPDELRMWTDLIFNLEIKNE